MRLSDIVPEDLFVGTSLILGDGQRFLYGIRPAKGSGPQRVLELTGIGGGLEPEDDSYSDGALREAQEEIGCDVTLIGCPHTIVVRGPNDLEWLELDGQERPAAVVFRHFRTPPHEPWHPDNLGLACLLVFAGRLEGRPEPVMELPHLIWLDPEHILETARRDVTLGALGQAGATLVLGQAPSPPDDYLARMTDSQEALALALGEQTPAFYRTLGRLAQS